MRKSSCPAHIAASFCQQCHDVCDCVSVKLIDSGRGHQRLSIFDVYKTLHHSKFRIRLIDTPCCLTGRVCDKRAETAEESRREHQEMPQVRMDLNTVEVGAEPLH